MYSEISCHAFSANYRDINYILKYLQRYLKYVHVSYQIRFINKILQILQRTELKLKQR